ncbi:MAG: hypothetical protein JW754_04395 [Candidatus Aenigmarchaeota archaeon]|nr:hypothetical protein [Candidatus Aenigmarchaeota archaeon]
MLEKETLKRMYLKEHKTIKEIANSLKISEFAISYCMNKYGLRRVERWERYGVKHFTSRQKQYLYGSLLGDDQLNMKGKRKYPFLVVTHGSKQKQYVEWKYKIWKRLVPGGVKSNSITLVDTGKKYFICGFRTAAHPCFLQFFRSFYLNGKKVVTREILNKLTPFSIAVWYMDDGYYRKARGRAQLSTNGFSYEENILIQKYFKETWSVSSNIGTSGSGTNYIWFNTENTIKFFKIIKNHISHLFNYKIDLKRKLQWRALSKEEIGYIKNNYNIESPQLIAHKLDRPLNTVFGVAWRLGVTQPRGGRKIYERNL